MHTVISYSSSSIIIVGSKLYMNDCKNILHSKFIDESYKQMLKFLPNK